MTQARLFSFTGRVLATVVLTTAGCSVLQAQVSPEVTETPVTAQAPKLDLRMPAADLKTSVDDALFSSSSTNAAPETQLAANDAAHFNMMNAMQYGGGRQRYGRPRYRGGNTNSDGSPKYDFFVGAGFTMPVGDKSDYLKTSWGLQLGAGRNFNKLVGVNLEFNWDQFGETGQTIRNYASLFDDPGNTNGFDANTHIWSLSINPIVNIYSGQGLGAYVTGGVGFYHKVGNFTLPQNGRYCSYYYCYNYVANQVIDHYTSNAPGFNGGFGVTYKFSRFSTQRLYAEVRYVYMKNEYKPGLTPANIDTYTGYNYFPQNSQTTTYIPVKFGLRF